MDTNERLLRAVQLSARKLVSAGHFDQLLREVLILCIEAVGAFGGTVYLHDPAKKTLRFHHVLPESVASRLPFEEMPDDQGIAGQVFHSQQTVVSTFDGESEEVRRNVENATGVPVHTMITVPLMMEDEEPIGVVQLINKVGGNFTEADAAVLDTVAAVSTMASMNSRLLEETTRASSLLGMGKVSHDIGNLASSLNANITFTEMALEGRKEEFEADEGVQGYVESLKTMIEEMTASVARIVSYSKLISDLSVGKPLTPNLFLAPLGGTIQLSAAYLESEGRKHSVAIRYDIQGDAPATMHDEQYIFRIVQNLVGNAIKAVKETLPEDWQDQFGEDDGAVYGEVLVHYRFIDDTHVIEVHDTGPGIPPHVAERILAGTARSQWDKASGSGWGTKIVLELAATHDGKVSIDSTPGHGATFRVEFPHREA
jgi:signal transduction histidine kinase